MNELREFVLARVQDEEDSAERFIRDQDEVQAIAQTILDSCQSIRRVVDLTVQPSASYHHRDEPTPVGQRPLLSREAAEQLLRLYALQWNAHPDYLEEWAL